MKNTKKNNQDRKTGPSPRAVFRALPIIAAMIASGIVQPAFAVDRTWFGGTGDFGVATNWTPNGAPGSGDKAIINSGNSSLSFNSGVAGLDMFGGGFLGAGDLAVSGLTTFTGGQIGGYGGNVIANGGLNISCDGNKTLGNYYGDVSSGIVNNATATWSGAGDLNNQGSGRFTNAATGNFNIQTDSDFTGGTLINQGTLTKSVGATDGTDKTVISGLFNNSGSVNVQQGVLSLTNGGTHTGSFASGENGWIEFAGGYYTGAHQLNAGAEVTGNIRMISGSAPLNVNTGATYNASHTQIVSGGQFAVTDAVTTANTGTLEVSGGSIMGAGDLAVSGLTTFTGGQIGGYGGNVIANGGLNISGDGNKTLGNYYGDVSSGIVNNATATWSGAGDLNNQGSGRFTNAATGNFNIQTDSDFTGGTLINQGTLTKSVGATDGTDKTTITGLFSNSGSVNVTQGTLEVTAPFNNEGTINVAAGAIFYGSNADFANAGTMQGNGTIQTLANNDLVNSGMINPGASSIGHLTIDGSLQASTDGALNFGLASLSSFDQLTVTDNVMLGGEIAVWNLGYTPVIGDSFVVATFDDRLDDSTFSSITTHGFASAVNFSVDYNEHNVMLTVVPEPEQYAMMLAGLGLMGAMARRRRT